MAARNLLVAPPESGKTWLVLAAILDVLRSDCDARALFIDFETDPVAIARRLRVLGAAVDEMARVLYVRPESPADSWDLQALRSLACPIVALEGLTAALSLEDGRIRDENDVTAFLNKYVRPFATDGACVLVTSHSPLSEERELGTTANRGGVDASLYLKPEKPWRPGVPGAARVTVLKDRPGGVEWTLTKGGRRHAATVRFRPIEDGMTVEVVPSANGSEPRENRSDIVRPNLLPTLRAVRDGCDKATTIAARTNRSETTVREHLRELKAMALIEESISEPDGQGRRRASKWSPRRSMANHDPSWPQTSPTEHHDGAKDLVKSTTTHDEPTTTDADQHDGAIHSDHDGGSVKTPVGVDTAGTEKALAVGLVADVLEQEKRP